MGQIPKSISSLSVNHFGKHYYMLDSVPSGGIEAEQDMKLIVSREPHGKMMLCLVHTECCDRMRASNWAIGSRKASWRR